MINKMRQWFRGLLKSEPVANGGEQTGAKKIYKHKWVQIGAVVVVLAAACLIGFSLLPPKIEDLTPEVIAVSEDAEIVISGKYFGKSPTVLVNDIPVAPVTQMGETRLRVTVPASLMKVGEKKVQVVADAEGLVPRRSNSVVLTVKRRAEQVGLPLIEEVVLEETADTIGLLTIRGESFTDPVEIHLNGTKQAGALRRDENTLFTRISIPKWCRQEKLSVMVHNSVGFSKEYILDNPYKTDMAKTRDLSDNFIQQGYLIAHRMNSVELFESHYADGFRVFEIDFQLTSDMVLATLHDRPGRIGTFAQESAGVPYDLQSGEAGLPYTLMSIDDVFELLQRYPDAYIVTDTKNTDFRLMKLEFDLMAEAISRHDPALYDRIVVQVYNQDMFYYLTDNYPFTSYLYTLYSSSDTDEEVLEFVEKTGIPAVTMSTHRATAAFTQALNTLGVKTYTHTVTDVATANEFLYRGMYGLYVNNITYADLAPDPIGRFATFEQMQNGTCLDEESLARYIDITGNSGDTVVIAIHGVDMDVLGDKASASLEALGIRPGNGPVENYYAILEDGQVRSAGAVTAPVELAWEKNKIRFAFWTDQNDTGLRIDGQSVPMSEEGIYILSFNSVTQQFVDGIQIYSLDESKAFQTKSMGAYYTNNRAFLQYLDFLQQLDGERYSIILSVYDEGSSRIGSGEQDKLKELGFEQKLLGAYGWSYAAILNNGLIDFEGLSEETVETKQMLDGTWLIDLVSGGTLSSPACSITIDGTDYAVGGRGVNIVVFDKLNGMVVDSVCFDTYEDYRMTRLSGMPK